MGYWGSVWRGLLCVLLSIVGQGVWAQTNYFVASNGNDNNDGRSSANPFQTLAKVNSLSLRPGDVIQFRRGDTFRGTLVINQSGTSGAPIGIDAYGSGARPVLAGSALVSNWTSVGANLWQASFQAGGSRVSGVYNNGVALPLGRFPNLNTTNKGYLTVQSHSGKTQLTSQQGLSTNWTGGEVVVRAQKWITDRATITQQNGNTLSLSNSSNYDLSDGWGFFIQNHPATLDQSGEWYYNPSTKTILLYSTTNPNGQTITATAYDEAIRVENASAVIIQNLTITQARVSNVYALNSSSLTLQADEITNAGEDGVHIDGSGANVVLESNLFYKINNNGLTVKPYQNLTVRNNTIRSVGLVAGRSRSGDGQAIGLLSQANANTLIEGNVVDSIGYHGINFGVNTTIQRNTVSNFCLAKSDGGGIYIWNGNRLAMSNLNILSNIVYNAIGAPEGAPADSYSGANGIYLDDCTQNANVQGNTVFNCTGIGFYLHATTNIALQGNTSYNNGEGQLLIGPANGGCAARSNLVQNNIFVSKPGTQIVARYESNDSDLGSYGSFDNNYYARPFNDVSTIRAVNKSGTSIVGSDLALSEWQTRYQKDGASKSSPITYKSTAITGTVASKLANTFTSNAEGWSNWSSYGNGQVIQVGGGQSGGDMLDGGSLQVSFPSSSGRSDSYAIVTNYIGAVGKTRTYRIQFDAIASASGKQVQVYIRQRDSPWQDVSARTTVSVGTTRQHFDINLTCTADEANTLSSFQVSEDGKTLWLDNISLQEVGATKLNNSFSGNTEGWSTWSPYGNSQASQTTGQLDGGSLQVSFPSNSGRSDSYAIVTNYIGAVGKTRTYRIQFDAIASASGKQVQVYIRQRDSPWQDVSARTTVSVGTTRQHFDINLTCTADEANTLSSFQVSEDGKTLWLDNINLQEVTAGGQRLNNTFTSGAEGWSTWSPYGNSQANQSTGGQARTGQLDGGSLQVSFPNSSGRSDSYMIATNYIGSIGKAKTYRVQFDAIASGANKRLQVYLRQRDSPYQDQSARTILLAGSTRQRFDLTLTATADQANTFLIVQVDEDGQTVWLDNLTMQEVSTSAKNPDDYIQIVFNPTAQTKTVSLSASYRDVKNQVYSGQITLLPFSSAILFREEASARSAAADSEGSTFVRKTDGKIVYPVPTYDEFTFAADGDIQAVRVFDLMGRDRLQLTDIRQGQTVPFGNQLPTGQYILHVQYADGTHRSEKLVKVDR
ncbi:hypothetical protein GCM10028773_48790 [Spirosoma koreense]